MDSQFCVDALEEALHRYGKPAIFNSDQGAQFTNEIFTQVLKDNNIRISMDRYLLLQYLHFLNPCRSWKSGMA